MKKITKLCILSVILLSFILSTTNINGYETNRDVTTTFEQTSDNDELIGGLASITSYSYYSQPTIDGTTLSHDLTQISISRLQSATTTETDPITDTLSTSGIKSDDITEYICAAPFDTGIVLDMQYTNDIINEYITSIDVINGVCLDESIEQLNTDDNDYLEINTEINDNDAIGYTIIKGSIASGTITNTYEHDESFFVFNDESYGSGGYWGVNIEFTLTQQDYDYVSFVFTIAGDAPSITSAGSRLHYTDSTSDVKSISKGDSELLFDCSSNNKIAQKITIYYATTDNLHTTCSVDDISCYKNSGNLVDLDLNFELDDPYLNTETVITFNYKTSGTISQLELTNGVTTEYLSSSISEVSIPINSILNNKINIYLVGSLDAKIYIDFIEMNVIYQFIDSITVDNFNYEINSVGYEDDVLMNLIYYSVDFTSANLKFKIDSSQLEEYDYISDLTINTQQIDYDIVFGGVSEIDIIYFTTTSTNDWIIPSEINLCINGIEVEDETYNSGFCSLTTYPLTLVFTADVSNILFEFDITSVFGYDFELSAVSNTYLKSTLVTDTSHSLILTQLIFHLTSNIKHSYINNIDFFDEHELAPDMEITEDSSIKVEVLLSDDIYLPLQPASYESVENSYIYNGVIDGFQTSISSINYPSSTTITISNIKGYKSSMLYDAIDEEKLIDEEITSTLSYESIKEPPTSITFTTGSADSSDYSRLLDDGNIITDTPSSLVRNTDWDSWTKKRVDNVGTEYDVDSENNVQILDRTATQHLRTCAIYDNRNNYYTKTYRDYSTLVTGYISFRWYLSDVTKTSFFMLFNNGNTQLVWMKVASGNLQWYSSSSYSTIMAVSINTLYHVRINFDCSGATDTAVIFVNGDEKATKNFQVSSTEIKRVQFQSDRDSTGGYYQYVDSVRFSNTLSDHTVTYVPATTQDYELEKTVEIESINLNDIYSSNLLISYYSSSGSDVIFQVYDNDLESYSTIATHDYSELTEFIVDLTDVKYFDNDGIMILKIISEDYTSFSLVFDKLYLDNNYITHSINYDFDIVFESEYTSILELSNELTIECGLISYQLYLYNYYTSNYDTINDIDSESQYPNLYISELNTANIKIITDIVYNDEFTCYIDGIVTLTYYLIDEYSYLEDLDITDIDLTINNIPITENIYELELDNSITLLFETVSVCFFDVQIDTSCQIENNYEQTTVSMTTDDNVWFRYNYKADHDYNKWYITKLDNLVSYNLYQDTTPISSQYDSTNIYFTKSLLIDDLIYADYVIDPNIVVTTTVLENTGTYCNLQIDVTSEYELSGVTVIVSDFNSYFEDWIDATQDPYSKKIQFYVGDITYDNTYYLEATTTPPMSEFGDYNNIIEFIDEYWNEDIEYEVNLIFPQYSEMFRIPETEWTLDGVFYGDRSYAIEDNLFTCEGFNENTLTAYLHFFTNPIISFTQEQSENSVTINIESSLELDCYIVFHIEGLRSYNFDDSSVTKYYNLEGIDYYYIQVHLNAGINTFTYAFTKYDITQTLIYIIPIGVVVLFVIVGYSKKKKKNTEEKPKEKTIDKLKRMFTKKSTRKIEDDKK